MSSSLQVKPIVIGTVKFILASFAITYCPLDDIKFGGFLEYIGSQLAKIGKFFQGSILSILRYWMAKMEFSVLKKLL